MSEYKVAQIFPKVVQKAFTLKLMSFKIAQKATKQFGLFFNHQELSKIEQSGHIENTSPKMIRVESSNTITLLQRKHR